MPKREQHCNAPRRGVSTAERAIIADSPVLRVRASTGLAEPPQTARGLPYASFLGLVTQARLLRHACLAHSLEITRGSLLGVSEAVLYRRDRAARIDFTMLPHRIVRLIDVSDEC